LVTQPPALPVTRATSICTQAATCLHISVHTTKACTLPCPYPAYPALILRLSCAFLQLILQVVCCGHVKPAAAPTCTAGCTL
jgi:hypothetical protein